MNKRRLTGKPLLSWRIKTFPRRVLCFIEWRILRRAANAFVFWYLDRCLLTEIHEPRNGRFVKAYPNYNEFKAAGEGVFRLRMGRPSAASMSEGINASR